MVCRRFVCPWESVYGVQRLLPVDDGASAWYASLGLPHIQHIGEVQVIQFTTRLAQCLNSKIGNCPGSQAALASPAESHQCYSAFLTNSL